MCRAFEELIMKYKKESVIRILKRGVLSNEEIAEGLALDIDLVNSYAEEFEKQHN